MLRISVKENHIFLAYMWKKSSDNVRIPFPLVLELWLASGSAHKHKERSANSSLELLDELFFLSK